MRKPRFGIDIDGTVTTPDTLLPHINKAYNVNLQLKDVVEYSFLSAFPYPVDPQQFQQWFSENEEEMYRVSDLYPQADKVLQKWQSQFELYYISARDQALFDVTQQWFEQHQVPYDHIELIGSHNKLAVAKNLQVEAFFEDKHDNAVMLAEELKIPVVLFDTPYNRDAVPNQVIRVSSWQQANDFIKKYFA